MEWCTGTGPKIREVGSPRRTLKPFSYRDLNVLTTFLIHFLHTLPNLPRLCIIRELFTIEIFYIDNFVFTKVWDRIMRVHSAYEMKD